MYTLLLNNFLVFLVFIVILGLLVGSFLNVVIYRYPLMEKQTFREECLIFLNQKEAISKDNETFNLSLPRSHCPVCKTKLKIGHNIPILSYFLLRGKCGFCKAKISFRYPLIEAFTASLSIVIAFRFGFSFSCLAALIFTWYLIAITVIDFDHQLIFDSMSLSLLWIGLVLNCLGTFTSPDNAIFGAIIGYGFFWMVNYLFKIIRKKEGMGHGDFKLFAASGAWFGCQMLPITIFISCLLALFIGATTLFLKRKSQQTPIPFGPFIAAAMFITLLFGHNIMQWYLHLL